MNRSTRAQKKFITQTGWLVAYAMIKVSSLSLPKNSDRFCGSRAGAAAFGGTQKKRLAISMTFC